MDKKPTYGYISGTEEDEQWIQMANGQNISGYSVGILHIDKVCYPMLPGNVVNACTYDFPVRMKAVKDLDTTRLHSGDPDLFKPILETALELQREGVRAIAGACGFFGHFQSKLADALDIPVAVTSLVQVPWIQAIQGKNKKIGVLSANASAMTEEFLWNCGIRDTNCLVVKDLRNEPSFSAIMENRSGMDNVLTRQEVVQAAVDLTAEHQDIAAICLECSDMPPYSAAIQRAAGLPVFDYITMIRWLHNAVNQRPYSGWV